MKNGTDVNEFVADHTKFCANTVGFAVQMRQDGQNLYEFSTKLDADKRGCDGFARIIRINLLNPPNSWSICDVYSKKKRQYKNLCRGKSENGTDADTFAVHRWFVMSLT